MDFASKGEVEDLRWVLRETGLTGSLPTRQRDEQHELRMLVVAAGNKNRYDLLEYLRREEQINLRDIVVEQNLLVLGQKRGKGQRLSLGQVAACMAADRGHTDTLLWLWLRGVCQWNELIAECGNSGGKWEEGEVEDLLRKGKVRLGCRVANFAKRGKELMFRGQLQWLCTDPDSDFPLADPSDHLHRLWLLQGAVEGGNVVVLQFLVDLIQGGQGGEGGRLGETLREYPEGCMPNGPPFRETKSYIRSLKNFRLREFQAFALLIAHTEWEYGLSFLTKCVAVRWPPGAITEHHALEQQLKWSGRQDVLERLQRIADFPRNTKAGSAAAQRNPYQDFELGELEKRLKEIDTSMEAIHSDLESPSKEVGWKRQVIRKVGRACVSADKVFVLRWISFRVGDLHGKRALQLRPPNSSPDQYMTVAELALLASESLRAPSGSRQVSRFCEELRSSAEHRLPLDPQAAQAVVRAVNEWLPEANFERLRENAAEKPSLREVATMLGLLPFSSPAAYDLVHQ
eukprot:Cvel_26169.t2-p1 / transcript=Cvel_26169.t2 / gene=Cvel_26169 / organism=Chromera_velia_CCMP2878 / gene_product=hypothetical protein / transcript_product=hypothetical protein / location=Cvel_scaffold3074:12444-14085(-) / protein_length=514 / sequence_SO=supercontig / SO=protein_coding / is_pseudo=false